MRPDLRRPFVLRVALGQIATLPVAVAGIAVLADGLGSLYWLVAGTVFLILVAVRSVGAARRDQSVGEARGF